MGRWLLFLLLVVPPVAIALHHETITSVLIIVWVALIIPLCIVQGIDYLKQNPQNKTPFQIFARLLVGLLGLLALLMGAGIVAWCLYNVFVKRLPDYTGPQNALSLIVGGFGIAPTLIAFGGYLLRLAAGKENRSYDEAAEGIGGTEGIWWDKER